MYNKTQSTTPSRGPKRSFSDRSSSSSRPVRSSSSSSPSFSRGVSRAPYRGGGASRSNFASSARSSFSSGRPSSFGRNGGGSRKPMRGDRIDPSKFIYKPTAEDKVDKQYDIKHTFADFGFSHMVNANLARKVYTIPSPIQDQTIMHAMAGRDVVGLAKTGSGKTAAFLLPFINIAEKNPNLQVLIMAPTRELAMQINKELRDFTQGMRIFSTVCVGGMPIYQQINDLKRKNNFIIGTPGRLKDLAERGVIKFNNMHGVVLDEVDHMLDMGFIDDITRILESLPKDRQSLFFSATMPPRIQHLVAKFLKDPVTVDIDSGKTTKNVEQDVIRVTDRTQKLSKLLNILEHSETEKTLIFVETKSGVEKLEGELKFHGYEVGYLHGDKPQRARSRTLEDFRNGKIHVLIATDVAARGIDVKDITHVVNYTVPQTYDDYIHRIGRTGRAGKTGKAFTFV